MNDSERILGRLEEFKDHAMKRLDTIESKVDELQRFKLKIVGGATVASFIGTIVVHFFTKLLQ